MANINRDQYGKPDLGERQAPFSAQVGMWWLYFKWQWLRDAHGDAAGPAERCSRSCSSRSASLGGVAHWRDDRASFWFFGPLVFTVTLVLVYYMNFKYGASQAPELAGVAREVRDRDYFYLWSYSTWSVWAALGLAALWRAARRRGCRRAGRAAWAGERARPPASALVPLLGNWRAGVARRRDGDARMGARPPQLRRAVRRSSSPSATTTPSPSGTRRRSRASGPTSPSR